MDGAVTAKTSVRPLLRQLHAEGFELAVQGDRLRIRPVNRVTPALRDVLIQHKAALLALLQPKTEYISLKGGLVVPLAALRLAWDLESRGFELCLNNDGQLVITPANKLTALDGAAIHRWRPHLSTILGYTCEPPN